MTLLDIALIILSIAGLLLFVFGIQKRSRSYIVFGGTAFIAPIFYLIGWVFLMPMAPPIALVISLFTRKREDSA